MSQGQLSGPKSGKCWRKDHEGLLVVTQWLSLATVALLQEFRTNKQSAKWARQCGLFVFLAYGTEASKGKQ